MIYLIFVFSGEHVAELAYILLVTKYGSTFYIGMAMV